MKKQTVVDLIKALEGVRELHRSCAESAKEDPMQNSFDVYEHVKESMAYDTKVRRIRNRYQHVLEGK